MISCKCWFVCPHLFPTDWYWIDHWLKGSLPRCNIFAVCSGKCWLSPSAMALNVPRARVVTHTGMYGRWQHICIISQLGEAELTGWPVQVRRQWRMPTAAVPGMLATGRQAIEWLAPSLGAYCAESDNLRLAMKNTHDQRNTDLFTFLFAPAPLIAGFVVGTSLTLIVHNVNYSRCRLCRALGWVTGAHLQKADQALITSIAHRAKRYKLGLCILIDIRVTSPSIAVCRFLNITVDNFASDVVQCICSRWNHPITHWVTSVSGGSTLLCSFPFASGPGHFFLVTTEWLMGSSCRAFNCSTCRRSINDTNLAQCKWFQLLGHAEC